MYEFGTDAQVAMIIQLSCWGVHLRSNVLSRQMDTILYQLKKVAFAESRSQNRFIYLFIAIGQTCAETEF